MAFLIVPGSMGCLTCIAQVHLEVHYKYGSLMAGRLYDITMNVHYD